MTPLHDLSATELLARYGDGSLSPVEATKAVLERIAAWEPHLHATYAIDAEAAIAAAHVAETRWQKHRDAGEPIGALEGVPATIKENIATRGTPTPLAVPVAPFTAPTQVVGDSFADGKTTVLAAQTGALTGTRALAPATGAAGPMPPLQGPEDDDDWLADDAGPAPAKRRRWPWLLAGLLLLLLLGGGPSCC